MSKLILGVLLFSFFYYSYGASTVIQTGVATSDNVGENINIEKLREQAIRNAMDLALLEVSGALVSSERSDTLRSNEKITSTGNNVKEVTKQESRYQGRRVSRTAGYVRLSKIMKEWQDGQQYYVKVMVEVGDEKEVAKSANAGFYWSRMGKPPISLSLVEIRNGVKVKKNENYTFGYLRNNLVRNDINVSEFDKEITRYNVKINQELTTQHISILDTFKTNCRLSYSIQDMRNRSTLAEYHLRQGPDAGFTELQAEERCVKKIAPKISKQLVKAIAKLMNEQWNDGIELNLKIYGLKGEYMPQAVQAVQTLFRVRDSVIDSYDNEVLQLRVIYKGQRAEFTDALMAAFDGYGWGLKPETVQGALLKFRWKDQNN